MGLDHANSFAHKELLADASFKWGRYPASPDAALNQLLGMKEYELYLPLAYNDGSAIPAEKLDHCRKLLLDEFGGFTHFPQENEGVWKLGGIVSATKSSCCAFCRISPITRTIFLRNYESNSCANWSRRMF